MTKIIVLLIVHVCILKAGCFDSNLLRDKDSDAVDQFTDTNETYFLVQSSSGEYYKEPLTGLPKYFAEISDVKFYFYNRQNPDDGAEVSLNDTKSLHSTGFSSSKTTIFIVHGWRSDVSSGVNTEVKEAYLNVADVNVIVVDWSKIAKFGYLTAQANVKTVGKIVGTVINYLASQSVLNLENVVLIGHSLGAHVCGVIGATIGSLADHIVGLDPAGPLFTRLKPDNLLDPSDAKYVQVIHTCAGGLGFLFRLGHSDYWPNGGSVQPGCGVDPTGSCSHTRSYQYFAESISARDFKARKCPLWTLYALGTCANNARSWMGQVDIDKSASGNYYLATNSETPYGQG